MRHDDELSGGEVVLWAVLGAGAGLLASIALSEWVGEVNSGRVRRIAERLREQGPTRMTAAASARAVQVALNAEPRLAGLPIEARAVSRGAVELRGWVPSRSMRTAAGRTALAVPGIESVINSLLVRGEDDRPSPDQPRAADQSA
ncbi:MAG TPA: BON domain-containing protein [Gemmatimonadales bacterium]|nr:BON domain-containing protein [Gemmatimonadales bacterium]HVJ99259.1 BON domain-containing protein [Gemmatimonadales bacterium]